MSSLFLFAAFILQDQIRLAREEIMEYVRRIPCRAPFVDDVTVFAIFLAVCSPSQQSTSFLKGCIEQVLADRISDLVVV